MGNSATNAGVFIITALAHLYLLVLLLRLLLPWMGADFRNPLAQAILRLTSPLVVPVRRVVPPFGKLDTATIIVAFAIQYLTILLIAVIMKWPLGIIPIAVTAAVNLVILTLRLFAYAIIVRVLLSWFAATTYNPATAIIDSLTEPVLRPFRQLLPPMGGLDLSPLFAMLALFALSILISGLKMLPI
jgi:YggT family protein